MVQRMPSGHSKVKVKSEMDDPAPRENPGPPPRKRPRFEISSQSNNLEAAAGGDISSSSQVNEASPLGLRLKKSPSLLELIQMRLSQQQSPKSSSKNQKANLTEKLKASNFPASLLIIGTWEYKSKYEGDLVAKCYFAKHKLVWEVLDGSLKNKIEIQWSDIVGIKANYAVEGTTDTLQVVLARQPLFFRETNPQPRKHTLWQPTSDFTTGQASLCRHHVLHCTQGLLARHFEKLTQCDPRLNFLSQKPELALDCPHFDQKVLQTEPSRSFGLNNNQDCAPFFAVPVAESSSLKNESHDLLSAPADNYSSSPSSVMDTGGIEDVSSSSGVREVFGRLGRTRVSGITPSISMSDLVSHIGRCIAGGGNPSTFPGGGANDAELSSSRVLEEISRYLLNDSSNNNSMGGGGASAAATPLPDGQSLMCRVNSLYSLLQKDVHNLDDDDDDDPPPPAAVRNPAWAAMSRKDSVSDLLLLNLPRIASLPHILPFVSEDCDGEKRERDSAA